MLTEPQRAREAFRSHRLNSDSPYTSLILVESGDAGGVGVAKAAAAECLGSAGIKRVEIEACYHGGMDELQR
jgi:hypothetical protein